jgi:hypothetical protein
MQEEWAPIEGFPGYTISNFGGVRKEGTRDPVQSPVQYGILTVGLRREDDPKVYRRAIPLLVARAFLPDPPIITFDTPIHLDGDRSNSRADNLMWRPRWFAIQFHKQFKHSRFEDWSARIMVLETGEVFDTIQQAARTHGLLETSIYASLCHPGDWVYPKGYHFLYTD